MHFFKTQQRSLFVYGVTSAYLFMGGGLHPAQAMDPLALTPSTPSEAFPLTEEPQADSSLALEGSALNLSSEDCLQAFMQDPTAERIVLNISLEASNPQAAITIPNAIRPSQILRNLMKVSHNFSQDTRAIAQLAQEAEELFSDIEKITELLEETANLKLSDSMSDNTTTQSLKQELEASLKELEDVAKTMASDALSFMLSVPSHVLALNPASLCAKETVAKVTQKVHRFRAAYQPGHSK